MNRLLQFRKKILKKEQTPEVPSEEAEYNPNEYGTVVDGGGHGEHAKKPKKTSLKEAVSLKRATDPSEEKPPKPKFNHFADENENSHLGYHQESVERELHSRHNYDSYPNNKNLYKYTQGSYDLNRHLIDKHNDPKGAGFSIEHHNHALNLDKATRFKPLGHELHTYHGAKFHPGLEAAKHPENRLFFPGFVSTSLDKHKAKGFTNTIGQDEDDNSIKHVIHFHHKDENKGSYIGKESRHSSEKEFLVPRSTSVKIHPIPTKYDNGYGSVVHVWHATDIQHHPVNTKLTKEEKAHLKRYNSDPVFAAIHDKDISKTVENIKNGKFTDDHKELVKNDKTLSPGYMHSIFNTLAEHGRNLNKEELVNHVSEIPDNYPHLTNEKIDHIIDKGRSSMLGSHAANLSQSQLKKMITSPKSNLPKQIVKNRRLTTSQLDELLTKDPSIVHHLEGSKLNHVVKTNTDSNVHSVLVNSKHLTPDHLTHLLSKSKDWSLNDLMGNEHNYDKFTKKHIDTMLSNPDLEEHMIGNMRHYKNMNSDHLSTIFKKGVGGAVAHPNFKVTPENSKDILSSLSYNVPEAAKIEAAKQLPEKHIDDALNEIGRDGKMYLLKHNDKLNQKHLLKIAKNYAYAENVSDLVAKHKNYDADTALKHIQLGKDEYESHHIKAALNSGKLSRQQLRDLKLSDHSDQMEDLRKEVLSKLAMKEINKKIDDERAQKVNPEPEEQPKEIDDERLHKLLDNHHELQKNSGVNMPAMSKEDYAHLQNSLQTMKHGHITKLLKLKNYTQSKLNVLGMNPNVTKGHLQAAFKDEDNMLSKYALSRLVKF